MEKSTIELEEFEEGDDFLLELAAIEAEAEAEAAVAKRPRVSTPEGPYMAALKGSKSEQWKLSPLNPVAATGAKYGSEAGQQDFPEKNCPCGVGLCLVLTSNTQKNPGRKFYKCPDTGGCGFFQWCDEVQSSGTHKSKFPDHQCPCGAGLCRVFTTKKGENIGRQYYRCPVFEGACKFFKWCSDDAVSSPTTYSFTKNSNLGDSDTRGYQISKTGGKEGHWARDSIVQSGNPLAESGPVIAAGECYKCKKQGHWARDCPAQSANLMSESGQVKTSGSGGECYKCGKHGHWVRDCPAQSDNQQFQSGQGKSASSGGACYKCGNAGHWARDCTLAAQSTSVPGKRQRQY